RHARLASYDIYSTCFAMWGLVGLAMMAELELTDAGPRSGPRSRRQRTVRVMAILLAGVSLGLSMLSKAPVPIATVCLPLGLWLLIFHRRPQVFIDLGLAAVVCAVVALPWFIVIGIKYPGAWTVWFREGLQNSTAVSNNPAQTASDL